jgi:hypothetical protein
LVRTIINIWSSCGFGIYLISEFAILEKLIKLHKKYELMKRQASLTFREDTQVRKEKEFEKMMEQLFDISHGNFEELIRSDKSMPRSEEAILEDMEFLEDQRTERKWYISDQEDEEMQGVIVRRMERYKRMEQYQKKQSQLQDTVDSSLCPISEDEFPEESQLFEKDKMTGTLRKEEDYVPPSPKTVSDCEDEYLPTKSKKSKIRKMNVGIEVTTDSLLEATTPLSVTHGISVRSQTLFLSSVIHVLGGSIKKMGISRSSVHRHRFKILEKKAIIIRENYREEMKRKKLVLHFDGKIVRHFQKEFGQTIVRDRIAVSITSPEFEDMNDRLLGILPSSSGRAADQVLLIHNLLEYYEVIDDLFAVCCDTTSTNTGRRGGIIHLLTEVIKKPLLWLLCRHHIIEIHISHVMKTLFAPTKGPDRKIYRSFREQWEKYREDIRKAENVQHFKRFDETKLLVGSKLYSIYQDAKSYIKYLLENEVFSRGDYNHLVEYIAFYLNIESSRLNDFKIYQPGACHNARFMADALYILALEMTSPVIDYVEITSRQSLEKAAFVCAVVYGPWYLKSSRAQHAS